MLLLSHFEILHIIEYIIYIYLCLYVCTPQTNIRSPSQKTKRNKVNYLSYKIEGRVLRPDGVGYELVRAGQLKTSSLKEAPSLDRECVCVVDWVGLSLGIMGQLLFLCYFCVLAK